MQTEKLVRGSFPNALNSEGANENPYSVTTVERAIDVLDVFTARAPELSLVHVAALAGLHKATAFRLLKTLCHRGLVVRLPSNGHYRLGYGMIGYAEIAKDQSGLVGLAYPVMRGMRDALNETVFLSVRIGDHRIDVEQVEGLQELRRVLTLGERKPLYAGSTSKVLLSGMPDWEIEAYLTRTDLVAFSAQTIVDKASLWSQINAIRETGLAEGWDERNSGGAGAAAPIRGPNGETMAAIAIGVPIGRLTPALSKRVMQTVRDGANEISALLCKAAPTKGLPIQNLRTRSK